MSDPTFQADDLPPPKPPRPTGPRDYSYDDDFLLAQQLQQEEQRQAQAAGYGRQRGDPRLPQQRKETGLKPNELYDKEHSFFDGRRSLKIYWNDC